MQDIEKPTSKQHLPRQKPHTPEVINQDPAAIFEQADFDQHTLTTRTVLQLQQAAGNQAVARFLAELRLARSPIQFAAEQRSNQTGLPDELKAGVENLSGYSLDNVRVHYDSPEPARLQALAYTQGSEIHVAPGQECHLPHEAWHVVQQMQGRVKPTLQMNGNIPVNHDDDLEHEADEMGKLAVAQKKDITTVSTLQTDNKTGPINNTIGLLCSPLTI